MFSIDEASGRVASENKASQKTNNMMLVVRQLRGSTSQTGSSLYPYTCHSSVTKIYLLTDRHKSSDTTRCKIFHKKHNWRTILNSQILMQLHHTVTRFSRWNLQYGSEGCCYRPRVIRTGQIKSQRPKTCVQRQRVCKSCADQDKCTAALVLFLVT